MSSEQSYTIIRKVATIGGIVVAWMLTQYLLVSDNGIAREDAMRDAALFTVVMATAAAALYLVFRYYKPLSRSAFQHVVLVIAMALLVCFSFEWLSNLFAAHDTQYPDFVIRSLPLRGVVAALALGIVSVIQWVQTMAASQHKAAQRRTDAERLLRESELIRLRQQLQPHFLFNSLNSISALTGSNPRTAREMTEKLSDFLRSTLRNEKNEFVSVKDELKQVGLFLDIEKTRFPSRLKINFNIDPATETLLMPALMLQPVAENAVKHAVYSVTGEIEVSIEVSIQQGELKVVVANPAGGESPSTGEGFGLSSLKRRLFLLYSRHDLLQCGMEGNRFVTRISFPQKTAAA